MRQIPRLRRTRLPQMGVQHPFHSWLLQLPGVPQVAQPRRVVLRFRMSHLEAGRIKDGKSKLKKLGAKTPRRNCQPVDAVFSFLIHSKPQ